MSALRMHIPITKIDLTERLVYGVATGETLDRSGEICDYASTKPLYEKWSGDIAKASGGKSLGNVRAMHGKVAAGKVTTIAFNDEAKQIEICAKVVDDAEWAKCVEGVYTGFSQGGGYAKRWKDEAGLQRYTAEPSEVSLVDLPCLPEATFQMIKAAGDVETKHFAEAVQVKVEPSNADVATKAGDLAKAAGQSDWTAFIEPARAELVKAALPAPAALAEGEVEPVASSTPPAPIDGLEQVWKAKDGTTFAKKADAVAHNATIDASPTTKAVLDAIDAIGGQLGIAKADTSYTVTSKKDGKIKNTKHETKDAAIAEARSRDNADHTDILCADDGNGLVAWKKGADKAASNAMRAATAEDLRKDLYTAARFAEMLASLKGFAVSTEANAAYAGNAGYAEVAAMLKPWIAQGCEMLMRVIQSTCDELSDDDGAMMLAAGSKLTAGHVAMLGKVVDDVPAVSALLEKAGRRNSKADADTIQAMHDHSCSLGATCDSGNCDDGASKAAGGDLSKALAAMTSDRDLAKARGDALQSTIDDRILPMLKTIGEKVANIERQPMPLPFGGKTRVVSKGADEIDGVAIADQLAKLKTENPDAYALLMIKAAQQSPQPYQHAR